MLVIGVTRMPAHSLTSKIGITSRSHGLVGEEFRILRMSSSDSGSKEDRRYCFSLVLLGKQVRQIVVQL